MASNPSPSDLTQCSAEALLAALRTLGPKRKVLGGSVIRELVQRDMSLNEIAETSGMSRRTVQRWVGKADQ